GLYLPSPLILSDTPTPGRRESICGTLHSVDQYLNIKLTDISVTDPEKYPHMLSVKNCFIRGSVVRYVQLPADEVDTQLLQ
ncbi:U6 snRNA-associated Sm-like protein LSm2, partial [Psammomys obesus]|uniref:U6 snRNA-associated Sm-like protein LSm2 n=1 Tax=Psammomys obesus TaxID=48139 RepID=UPI002452E6FC